MKFVQREIKGKKVTSYLVDKDLEDQIDRVLKTKDDKLIDSYFLLIHEQQLKDRANTRRHQSLELSIKAGHQFVDDSASLEDIVIENDERRKLYAAISILNEEQQWLLKQIYVLGRKQYEVGNQLGMTDAAIRKKLYKIYKILRTELEK